MHYKKSIVSILFWCLCLTLTAQTSPIDSLEQILASGKGTQLEKAELLIELSHEYLLVDTAKCKTYALEALRLARNNASLEGSAYNALGLFYQFINEPYQAHVNYKNAEKLFLKHNDKENLSHLYNNLMLLFFDIEDRENSSYYAEKAQEMAAEQNDLAREITAQFILGWSRIENNKNPEALEYFLDIYRKSIPLDTTITYFLATSCGEILIQQNRPHEALKYLHSAREYFEASGRIMFETYGYLAEAYAMINLVDSAEYYMKKAQESPRVTDDTKLILYRSRAVIDSIKGDSWGALASFKLYHQLSDSVANAGKTAEIGRMRNWYELEQKDNENQLLQKEHRKQRRLIWILAGSLVIIFALLAMAISFYRKTIEKNIELQKLHTVKDKLFSVVAHDLRSPIGALMSMLKLANRNMLDVETQSQLLKDISNRVDDTYGLLDNLLRWAKSQMQGIIPAPAYFDSRDESLLVTNTLQIISDAKKITIDNRIGNHQVYADRDMYAVLVRNLTANAIKYTFAKGEITLDSEVSGNMLVISVKDTGTGMPQEVQDKLFSLSETKSKRGTNNESGTGLGLVLCADFVQANGGKIWFKSKQGEGSTFYFSIPVKK